MIKKSDIKTPSLNLFATNILNQDRSKLNLMYIRISKRRYFHSKRSNIRRYFFQLSIH